MTDGTYCPEYYQANKDSFRASQQNYRRANKEMINAGAGGQYNPGINLTVQGSKEFIK